MESNELVSRFEQECRKFAAQCAAVLDHAVPSCPGWTVQDLIEHLGSVHRRAVFRIGSDVDPTGYEVSLPTESSEILSWYNAGWEKLYQIFQTHPPDYPAWNWTGKNMTLEWMIRRQAHEVAIHRFDAELAHMGIPSVSAIKSLPAESIPFGYTPEFAKDGIEERLEVTIGGRKTLTGSLPGSLHLHATDISAEWTVNLNDGVMTVENGHQKADAAIKATASELYLWSWGRIPSEILQCFGDMDVIDGWKKLPA